MKPFFTDSTKRLYGAPNSDYVNTLHNSASN